jgi:hypothetical protein
MLAKVVKGRVVKPRRVMVYGVHGVGKTTFGAMAPSPIFVTTEEGTNDIDCDRFPVANTYTEVMDNLRSIAADEHDYSTLVLDSLDWMEKLIWADVCRTRNVKNIEDIGFAKGYTFANNQWREVLTQLELMRANRNMQIILIAHSRVEKFNNPEGDPYDRYSPNLHKHASATVQEWCDEVLFACYQVYTKSSDEGFNKKRTVGIGSGQRILKTTERPSHLAKNRLNMPDEIPLDWRAYAEYAYRSQAQAPASVADAGSFEESDTGDTDNG